MNIMDFLQHAPPFELLYFTILYLPPKSTTPANWQNNNIMANEVLNYITVNFSEGTCVHTVLGVCEPEET